MPVFADHPRDPRLESALHEARTWCDDREIHGAPAFEHATLVARCVDEHLDDLSVEVAIAALLHIASDFAPAELNLDAHLAKCYGHPVPRIVRRLNAEKQALYVGDPDVDTADMLVLQVSTAVKIVTFRSLLHSARKSGDETKFFARLPELVRQTAYFQRFLSAVTGLVPNSMSTDLRDILAALTACRIG